MDVYLLVDFKHYKMQVVNNNIHQHKVKSCNPFHITTNQVKSFSSKVRLKYSMDVVESFPYVKHNQQQSSIFTRLTLKFTFDYDPLNAQVFDFSVNYVCVLLHSILTIITTIDADLGQVCCCSLYGAGAGSNLHDFDGSHHVD